MKNSQLEIRYRTGENLLWVDNDNRLYAEHRKSIQNREKVYGMRKNYTEYRKNCARIKIFFVKKLKQEQSYFQSHKK